MLCGLSGKDAVEPVVSPVSGKVYERSLIETWIAERGTDPATDTPLTAQQLVKLDLVPANPAITSTTSIPALLQDLQTEFNALALENFDLKQQNIQQQNGLRESEYKIEAALRVITRLTRERDELRRALDELDLTNPHTELTDSGALSSAGGQVDENHLPETMMGQGNAPSTIDNDKQDKRRTDAENAELADENLANAELLADADSNHMEVDENVHSEHPDRTRSNDDTVADLLGEDQPDAPLPPLPDVDTSGDILETRKTLTRKRKEFNIEASQIVFHGATPRTVPNASGDGLRTHLNWAIVSRDGQDTVIDLRTNTLVVPEWQHTVRHMSFLENNKPVLALLSTRRFAIWDLQQNAMKEAAVQGNPLEALWHPAGFVVLRFSGKIELYHSDTLTLSKELSLSVPKCLGFALHPDGEFLMYYSGAPNRARSLVFHSLIKREEALTIEAAGPVSSIVASNNGYHVAYFDAGALAILDLRNDDPPLKPELASDFSARQLRFDSTGRRLYVSDANLLFIYMPKRGEWIKQKIEYDDSVVDWSGRKLQVPIAVRATS